MSTASTLLSRPLILSKSTSTTPFRSILKPQSISISIRNLTTTPRLAYIRGPGDPTGTNEPPTHTNSAPSKSPLKVWPFVAIFLTGTFLFKAILKQREGEYQLQNKGPVAGHSPSRP